MFQTSWNINRKAHCVKLWKNIILTSKIGIYVVKIILVMIKYWREEVVLYPHKNTSEWIIAVKHQVRNLAAIGWREQVALRWDNEMFSWICIVLANGNKNHQVNMSLQFYTLTWFRANEYLLLLLIHVIAPWLVERQLLHIL